MPAPRSWLGILLFAVIACLAPCCGASSTPLPATTAPSSTCTLSVTMSSFNLPSLIQGMPFASYFATNVVPAQAVVDLVDVTSLPTGCFATWTAVSASTGAVQVSPAAGNGRGQVELFMPANTGAARTTTVSIAGQLATITQAGR